MSLSEESAVGALSVHVPLPRVLEGHDLQSGAGAVALGKELL
jgi:hypothetical protein